MIFVTEECEDDENPTFQVLVRITQDTPCGEKKLEICGNWKALSNSKVSLLE